MIIYNDIQFRLVLLNEDDSVKKVLYTSDKYNDKRAFDDALYKCLLTADNLYNFTDWENVPAMEFQKKEGETREWYFLSDPITDWMNL